MGTIDIAGTETTQSCEVFKSNGAFQVILGKPWLHSMQAIHKYNTDEITIQVQGQMTTITNEEDADPRETAHMRKEEMEQQMMKRGTQSEPTVTVHHVELEPRQTKDNRTADPGDRANMASQRARDPERMQAILQKILIGTDITDDEWMMVIDLIKEYPDIFALNLSEVFPVDFMMHKLKLDPDIVLPRKVHQQPIMEPQRKFFSDIIDDMEKAGVIHAVPAEFIKCLNAMHLAPKRCRQRPWNVA